MFYEFDIHDQIKFMFEHRNLAEILQVVNFEENNVIDDLTKGSEYIRVNKNRKPYDLTLILYTDGIDYSKSSKASLWPLMYVIAEIPAHLRDMFIIVCGVWYDNVKPVMNFVSATFCSQYKKMLHFRSYLDLSENQKKVYF